MTAISQKPRDPFLPRNRVSRAARRFLAVASFMRYNRQAKARHSASESGITVSLIGSVTHLLRRIKAGESGAWGKLLPRFWPFLLARAGRRLGSRPRRAAD